MAKVRRIGRGPKEYRAWRRWMRAIGALRERYYHYVGDDPLAVSEAATVGLMLSAAGEAGLIGMLEYPTEKRTGGPRRWCYGRCDLWLLAPRHADEYGWASTMRSSSGSPTSRCSRATRHDLEVEIVLDFTREQADRRYVALQIVEEDGVTFTEETIASSSGFVTLNPLALH